MISLIIEQSYCIGETVGIGIKLSNQIMLTLTHLKQRISVSAVGLDLNGSKKNSFALIRLFCASVDSRT